MPSGSGIWSRETKPGSTRKIADEAEIERLMAEGVQDRDYWIFTKDPSVQAFTALMDRAIDKPVEQVALEVTGEVTLIEARLADARKRLVESGYQA